MSEQKKKFHWIPHIIRHDFMRKFFALIFAMLVTATVYSDKRKHEDEVFVIHNVQPTLSLERGYVWKTRNLQQVSLTVRGPRAKLFDLKPEDFTLDYMIGEQEYQNHNKNGKQFVTLKATDVRCRHPKGALLQVLEINPSEYTFEIDKIGSETLELEAVFDTAGARYQVESSKFLGRDSVEVTGPLSILQAYKDAGKKIQTKDIVLKNQVADFTTNVGLKPIEGLVYASDSVSIAVKLKKISRKIIEIPQVSLLLPPEKSNQLAVEKFVMPSKVKVTVSGEVSTLDRISSGDLLLYVEFSDNTVAGTYKNVPIRCSIKKPGVSGVTAVFIDPMVIPEITLVEKTDVKPIEKEEAKPAEKAAEKTVEKVEAKLVEKEAEKVAAKLVEKTAEKVEAKPVEKTAEKTAEKTETKSEEKKK